MVSKIITSLSALPPHSESKKMSKYVSKADLIAALDDLATDCTSWFNGSYKKSNEELYALIGRCVGLHQQVVTNRPLRKHINDTLIERKITCNENASLETRMVRWVFGNCGNRAYAYASAIRRCVKDNITPAQVPGYIDGSGGLDALRRPAKAGPDEREKLRQTRTDAENYYIACPALFTIPAPVPELTPSSEKAHAFSVALLRQTDDGKSEIVYGSSNGTLVNSLLVEAGKRIKPDGVTQPTSRQNTVADVVQSILENGEVL